MESLVLHYRNSADSANKGTQVILFKTFDSSVKVKKWEIAPCPLEFASSTGILKILTAEGAGFPKLDEEEVSLTVQSHVCTIKTWEGGVSFNLVGVVMALQGWKL